MKKSPFDYGKRKKLVRTKYEQPIDVPWMWFLLNRISMTMVAERSDRWERKSNES